MTATAPDPEVSPVEEYLDDLLVRLMGRPPRAVRVLLAEADAHLRDATDEGIGRGLAQIDAERDAVMRFGSPASLATGELRSQGRTAAQLGRDVLRSGWWLGSLGALAVGVSGLLAWVVTSIGGATFMVGRPAAALMTPSACARWMTGGHGSTCAEAAVGDWARETSLLRMALGLAGAGALVCLVGWRRRQGRLVHRVTVLPPVAVDAVGFVVFAVAGVWLAGLTIDQVIVASGRGAGQWLSAAPVALIAAGIFLVRLVRNGDAWLQAGQQTLT